MTIVKHTNSQPPTSNSQPCLKLIQGPLAGVSSAPFRVLAHQIGQPDYCCSEMISAKHLVNNFDQQHHYIYRDPTEGKLCYQLSGNEPETLARATQLLNQFKPEYIDLNCGCPKPKIRKKNTGSKLLENEKLLTELLQAIKSNTDAQVSVKIRIDGESGSEFNQGVLDAAHQAEIDFIVAHARHWQDDYQTPPHYQQLAHLVKQSDLPMIGNGDIRDLKSLQLMLGTGVSGAMISRAGVGQPWLYQQLRCELDGASFQKPSLRHIREYFLQHLLGLIKLDGEFKAMLQARKLAKYYSRNQVDAQFIEQAKTVTELAHMVKLIEIYFTD